MGNCYKPDIDAQADAYASGYVPMYRKVVKIAFADGATAVEREFEEFRQLVGMMRYYQDELLKLKNKRDGEKMEELTYHLREVTKKVDAYLMEE